MKKNQFIPIVLCMTLMIFFAACSGSEEAKKDESTTSGEYTKTDKDEPSVPKTETPPSGTTKKTEQELPPTEKDLPKSDTPPRIETPPTTPQQIPPPISTTPKTGQIMWSVQIGAFKNEPGALQVANEARAKFNQPIYKDFDPVTGFWKVNIGSFATRDQATKFKTDVQAQGYPDAFCVEVRR